MPKNRFYGDVLFCPIAEIRLIWACFETEPDTGSDGISERVIRAQFGAGWGVAQIGGIGGITSMPHKERGGFFRNSPCAMQSFFEDL